MTIGTRSIPDSWGQLIKTNAAQLITPDPARDGINLMGYINFGQDTSLRHDLLSRSQDCLDLSRRHKTDYPDKIDVVNMTYIDRTAALQTLRFVEELARQRGSRLLDRIKEKAEDDCRFFESYYSGRRIFEFTQGRDDINNKASEEPPTANELCDFIVAYMNPLRVNVLNVQGHGTGMEIAEKTTNEIGNAIKQAQDVNGQTLDLLILNGCMMSFLPGLSCLANTAKVILASPITISGDIISGKYKSRSSRVKEYAKIKQLYKRKEGYVSREMSPIIAIDSSKINGLWTTYEKIEPRILLRQRENNGFSEMLKSFSDDKGRIDLGNFLRESYKFFPKEDVPILQDLKEAIKAAVVAKYIPRTYQGTSGISVAL